MPYKDPEAYREYQRRYREEHAEELRAAKREYQKAHPDTRKRDRTEYRKRYYAAHRAKAIADAKAYNDAHPEEYRAAMRAWQKNNPEKHRERQHRRRARMRGADAERIDSLVVAERDRWTCHLCDQHVEPDEASIDHVTPISQGGSHTYGNVRLAHLICNLRRGVMPVEQFRERTLL